MSTGCGAINIEADLIQKFGNGIFVDGFDFKPRVKLNLEAAEAFLKTFAIPLSVADWIVTKRSDREPTRCLLVYDTLKAFLLYGKGKRLHLGTASVGDFVYSHDPLYAAFGDCLGAEILALAGAADFVVTHETPGGPIQMVVQVKKNLSTYRLIDESTCGFLAELLAACRLNAQCSSTQEAEVFGCLTDAYTWQFFRAAQDKEGFWSIEAAEHVVLFLSGARATLSTVETLNFFFTALTFDTTVMSGSDVVATQQACHMELDYRAEEFVTDTLEYAKKDETIAQQQENVAQKQEEIACPTPDVHGQ